MAHNSMFEPEDQEILRDMYGGEAEFLQEQKEEEREHHAGRSGACKETFGREADRFRKRYRSAGATARRYPAASQASAGVKQGRHGWDISKRTGTWVLVLCITAAALMMIAGGVWYDERSLSANFPDEYTQAVEGFNGQYQFARTQEFAWENNLDHYDKRTAPYWPSVTEAEWEQQISDTLSAMLSLPKYIQTGYPGDVEYEAGELARNIRYLLRPQDYAPEASMDVKQRGVDAALAMTFMLAPDEAETLSSALMGDDYDQELAAEEQLKQRIVESVYAETQESGTGMETDDAADWEADFLEDWGVLGWNY